MINPNQQIIKVIMEIQRKKIKKKNQKIKIKIKKKKIKKLNKK